MKNGVLADIQIRELIQTGALSSSAPILNEQIQPASLDLRLSDRAYRVRASFLPGATTVAERLESLTMHSFPLTGGAVLERGCVYLIPLMERLSLPQGMTAAASAKSTIGRLDLLTRIITDDGKPDGTPRKLLSVSKMNALGWRPRISLEEGLRSVYAGPPFSA